MYQDKNEKNYLFKKYSVLTSAKVELPVLSLNGPCFLANQKTVLAQPIFSESCVRVVPRVWSNRLPPQNNFNHHLSRDDILKSPFFLVLLNNLFIFLITVIVY